MAITYTTAEIANNATSVLVTFTNEAGNVFSRSVNVPYKDGVLDETEWNQRLEDHLRAVTHKANLGVISFVPPSEDATTANT